MPPEQPLRKLPRRDPPLKSFRAGTAIHPEEKKTRPVRLIHYGDRGRKHAFPRFPLYMGTESMKKITRFLSSMPFAITLLILLAAACALSSAIPQGESLETYTARYGERTAGLIMALRLDDAFHSLWFIGLTGFLCLNLLCCNLIRLPAILKMIRAFRDPEKAAGSGETAGAAGTGEPDSIFSALRMPAPRKGTTGDGREFRFSAGNIAGFWGAWVCHAGILLMILGFALGQFTAEQYTVYMLPGQEKLLAETGLNVKLDDFRIDRTESGTVRQYTASLTVSDPAAGTAQSGKASVNGPAGLYGYKFFQNSTGWGADATVLKNGEELQREALCAGEFFPVSDKPELVVYLQAVYPDYVPREGMSPVSASDELKNPAYLYRVYYQGQLLGMNVLEDGEVLTIDEYTVLFGNPRNYSLLAVKRDRFTGLVLLGGLVTLAGLVLAFWIQPRSVWAVREESVWLVYGRSRKGGVLFRDELLKAAEQAGYHRTGGTGPEGGQEGEDE